MATAKMLRDIALSLPGTVEAPHFDRTAFKVRRIYLTVPDEGKTAHIYFTPDEQEMKCAIYPEAFAPLDNKWGTQGWTRMDFAKLSMEELRVALEMAHVHAAAKQGRGKL